MVYSIQMREDVYIIMLDFVSSVMYFPRHLTTPLLSSMGAGR
jgi:hypothetical protein